MVVGPSSGPGLAMFIGALTESRILAKIWRAGGQSRLVRVLFRDQVLWYVLIETVSIANLVVAYAASLAGRKGRGVVSCVLTTLTSISVCRIILNIRQTADEEKQNPRISDPESQGMPFSFSKAVGTASTPRTPISPSFKLEPYTQRASVQRDSLDHDVSSGHGDGRDVQVKKDEKRVLEDWPEESRSGEFASPAAHKAHS